MKIECIQKSALKLEVLAWTMALLIINASLAVGKVVTGLVFFPSAVMQHEWWRVVLSPLVHVNVYHLLLDGGAFLSLYALLGGTTFSRLRTVVLCSAGSLMASLTVPAIYSSGFCGLSGIAHGLLAYVALSLGTESRATVPGATLRTVAAWALWFLVVGKSMVEGWSGSVVLESWHLASVGLPLAACHTGGVIGGMMAWVWAKAGETEKQDYGRMLADGAPS
ncbi:MAG: hypothetical protein V2A34_05845 [Lentisphaerota bacterium]